MVDLCTSFLKLLADALVARGINKPMCPREAHFFSMFVMMLSYAQVYGEPTDESERLYSFQIDMLGQIIKEHLSMDAQLPKDQFFIFRAYLYNEAVDRYGEYSEAFEKDMNNTNTVFSNLLKSFCKHLFADPLEPEEEAAFVVTGAILFSSHAVRCRSAWQEAHHGKPT